MPGDVGYLVAVVVVGGTGDVDGFLVGVLELGGEAYVGGEVERGPQLGVDAPDVHAAQVEHGPAELLALGVGDDLVPDVVVVGVGADAQVCEPGAGGLQVVEDAGIVLYGGLGAQEGIAHVGVVEVVEGGHAVALLVEGAHDEIVPVQGLDRGEYGGGEA